MLGMMAAVASSRFGRQVYLWLQVFRNPAKHDSDESEGEMEEGQAHGTAVALSNDARFDGCLRSTFSFKPFAFLVVGGLLSAYLVCVQIYDIQFYRKMILVTILTPPGALLRWNLAKWNSHTASHRLGRFAWVPPRTFTANIIGSFISILFTALVDRYFSDGSGENQWVLAFFEAVGTGFAGSLSTVSSMVKDPYGVCTSTSTTKKKGWSSSTGSVATYCYYRPRARDLR
jgi:fluoride ion exporter CrcB/FEX